MLSVERQIEVAVSLLTSTRPEAASMMETPTGS
jgi:hypothetical protein